MLNQECYRFCKEKGRGNPSNKIYILPEYILLEQKNINFDPVLLMSKNVLSEYNLSQHRCTNRLKNFAVRRYPPKSAVVRSSQGITLLERLKVIA